MKKNLFLVLTCILLCASILLTFTSITINEDHDCIGEECHVCVEIQHAKSLLRDLTCAVALLATAIFLQTGIACVVETASRRFCFDTPITLKVKLLN